jgi:hypothetical protein
MLLNDWDIWHTYATYFTRPVQDLDKAARLLVTHRVAECAVRRDGHFTGGREVVCRLASAPFTCTRLGGTRGPRLPPNFPRGLQVKRWARLCMFVLRRSDCSGRKDSFPLRMCGRIWAHAG